MSRITARELLRLEAILGGSSAGVLLAAALRYCREQKTPKRVATFICDSGNKYLSKFYNDFWMADHGFDRAPARGDLRDLLTRRHVEGAVVTLSPEDTLLRAHQRMRLHEVSQLPVLQGEMLVGILDESDVLLAVAQDAARFSQPVRQYMSKALETLPVTSTVNDLLPIFAKGYVAIVVDGPRFLGLVTRIDLLNHLRMKVN